MCRLRCKLTARARFSVVELVRMIDKFREGRTCHRHSCSVWTDGRFDRHRRQSNCVLGGTWGETKTWLHAQFSILYDVSIARHTPQLLLWYHVTTLLVRQSQWYISLKCRKNRTYVFGWRGKDRICPGCNDNKHILPFLLQVHTFTQKICLHILWTAVRKRGSSCPYYIAWWSK